MGIFNEISERVISSQEIKTNLDFLNEIKEQLGGEEDVVYSGLKLRHDELVKKNLPSSEESRLKRDIIFINKQLITEIEENKRIELLKKRSDLLQELDVFLKL